MLSSLAAALVAASPDALLIVDAAGHCVEANPAALALLGYDRETLLRLSVADIMVPGPTWAAAEYAHLLGAGTWQGEIELRTHDGRVVPTEARAILLSDSDEAHYVAFLRDITERKQAEERLQQSEERFRTAFTSAAIGMALIALDGRFLQVNPALCALLGYSEAEFLARTFRDITHPDDLEADLAQVHRLVAGEIDHYQLEKRYRHKDGQVVWGHLSGALVRDASGAPQHFIGQLEDITERKHAEQALQQSEEQFRTAFDAAAIGMSLVDLDGHYLRVNAALCQLTGYAEGELLATTFHAITHPDDRAMDRVELDRLLTGQIPAFQREKRYLRQDGTVIWVRVNSALVHDEQGAPLHLIGQVEDITERKKAEVERAQLTEELRASEARYRTLIEQLPGAVYLLANDEHQTPLYFSPYIERITGETPEESMADNLWLALVHPDDRARVAAADDQHGEETDLFQEEYRHRHKDGRYVWVRDECVPIYDDTGQVVAWQGVMLDITDRMQATQAQAQLAALVESAEDAIISSDLNSTITSWNQGAEQLYGYTAEEMEGRSVTVLFPEGRLDAVMAARVAAARAGAPSASYTSVRRRQDGSLVDVTVALSPIRDHTGNVIGLSSITRDITAWKQAEAHLQVALDAAQTANAAKSQFLAMMSHELRTPLQAVLGYAEFLLADPTLRLSTEQRADLGYIQQGGRRMLSLITQLLDLSRLEADRLKLAHEPVDLADILEQVRQDVAPQVIQKGLILQFVLPVALPPVMGDPERLRQILLNVVGNAVKFTERGSVTIQAMAHAGILTMTVTDTGIGISPDELPHIFEAFRQVDSRLARRHGGAGLGLAIAQGLAELMGGGLTVESTLGTGSTFTLSLPHEPQPKA